MTQGSNQGPTDGDRQSSGQTSAPEATGQAHGAPAKERLSITGAVAVVVAAIGAICASTPRLFALGWILLAVAIVLSIVALTQKGTGRATSIAALCIAGAGLLFSGLVYFAFTSPVVSDIFGPTQPSRATDTAETGTGQNAQGEAGSAGNPLPLGASIAQGDWELTVNSVNLDATEEVLDENMYNEQPADGETYILVNITMKYVGDAKNAQAPSPVVAYETAEGQTRERFDTQAVAPDAFYETGALATGEEASGNIVFMVPAGTAAQGTLSVQPEAGQEITYVAVE